MERPVLVTGASGVVGSHVVRQLLQAGIGVVATDMLPGPGPLLDRFDVPYERVDVRDAPLLVEVIRSTRATRVIHLAALVGEWYNRHPMGNHETNVGGTLNVLEAARLCGLERVVFASTWSFYDVRGTAHGHPEYVPVPETMPPSPERPYEIAKYACERYAFWFRTMYGLEFAAMRFGNYYAAERIYHGNTRSAGPLMDLVTAAAARRPLRLERGADQGFDAIFVKDCAAGCVAAVLAEQTPSAVYNIGTGIASTLAQAAAILREAEPAADLTVGPGLLDAKHYCALDITRARMELGYAPRYSFRDGLVECMHELREEMKRR